MTIRQKEVAKLIAMTLGIGTFWVVFIISMISISARSATYEFKYRENTVVKVNSDNKYTAFKMASKLCFRTLTKNVYPGEERGLDVIDICANGVLVNEE